MSWEVVIGLEVHVQLATRTKLFCGCSTTFGQQPNANVCPVCLGLPGALPALNERAVQLAVRLGLALGCEIAEQSIFARKNYFYPDLPKGYQVSQYDQPLCAGGGVDLDLESGTKRVNLTRIHMEEDAGKNTHLAGQAVSHIDFNRAGTPLCEVVTEPELRSAEEATAFLKELRNIVRYTGVSDGHMEQGSFRCDANVSIRPVGQQTLGTRVELKNLNSFNFVKRAIEYEAARQADLIEGGGEVVQETRLWDERAGRTRSMRTKEEEHDYRYFSEPDLLPMVVKRDLRAAELERMVELPRARRQRYQTSYGLSSYDADVLTSEQALSDFFQSIVSAGAEPKAAANWVQGELRGRLNAEGLEISQSPVSAAALAKILRRVTDGRLSSKLAKQVFGKVYDGMAVDEALDEVGEQVTDEGAIVAAVRAVVDAHPEQFKQLVGGKDKVVGFFIGQVMKSTRGAANPQMVRQVLMTLAGR